MISLQTNNMVVDFYKDTTISINWKNLNFLNGNKYTFFTNDFTIPRTKNNETIFKIDEYWNTVYTKENTHKGLLFYEYNEINVYVYVVSFTDTDIKITCKDALSDIFEGVLNNNTKLYTCVQDTTDTIFGWSNRLMEDLLNNYNYRNNFLIYSNKVNNTNIYNRLHTSVNLVDYITKIFAKTDTLVDFGSLSNKLINSQYMVSTRKVVSPHNKKQILHHIYNTKNDNEEYVDTGTNYMKVVGSQHITNNIPGVKLFKRDEGVNVFETGLNEIEFNRKCKLIIKTSYVSLYHSSSYATTYGYLTIWRNNTKLTTISLGTPFGGETYFKKLTLYKPEIKINEGDVIRFTYKPYDNKKTTYISIVSELEIVDYSINDDDYNENLVYSGNLPYILKFNNSGKYDFKEFDGETEINSIKLPNYYFSYFGKYVNLPDVSLMQFLNSVCIKYGYFYSIEYVNGKRTFVFKKQDLIKDFRNYKIQEVTIYDDLLGEPSLVKTVSGDVAKTYNTICLYAPLKNTKTITTTVFENQTTKKIEDKDIITIKQYSYDTESGVEYLSPEGVYVGNAIRIVDDYFIYGLTNEPEQYELYNNGIENIRVVKKIKVKIYEMLTFDNIIMLDGVKIMVQDMDVNLQTKTTVVNGFVLNK